MGFSLGLLALGIELDPHLVNQFEIELSEVLVFVTTGLFVGRHALNYFEV
jgi:hypothetical protein